MLNKDFLLRPWVIAVLLSLLYSLAVIWHEGTPLALVTIGTQFSEQLSEQSGGTEGYDGQFVYYIVRDPTNAENLIDVPAYRYQRILLPALGILFSFGIDALIPWALLLINITALAAGTLFMEHLLVNMGVNRWYAITYGLTFGTFATTRLSLPEPLAHAFVLGGIILMGRGQWTKAAIVFALAALTRETTLLFVGGYGLYLLSTKRFRTSIAFGATAITPFIVWQLILFQRFGSFGIGSGGAGATDFELIPLAGYIRILTDGGLLVFAVLSAILIPFVMTPALWGLWQIRQALRVENWTGYTGILFANALIMLFVPFSTYREPLAILRFILGLQIAVILYAAHEKLQRPLLYSTLWIITTAFIFAADFG